MTKRLRNVINWSPCYFCQSDIYIYIYRSLERALTDLNAIDPSNLPSYINVEITHLDAGSGIAVTLRSNGANLFMQEFVQ